MTIPITLDMRQLLINASIGSNGGNWPIFIGSEPADPANCITLYDVAGEAPNPKWLLDFPRFQVRVRSNGYLDGFTKAEEIRDALLGLPSQTIGDIRYDGIYVVTDTFFLMADGRQRSIFVTMYRSIREPGTGTNRQSL